MSYSIETATEQEPAGDLKGLESTRVVPAEASERPLVDALGAPLLPRIARSVQSGERLGRRIRSVLDAGETYPAIDPMLLAQFQERGLRLHNQASADLLLSGFHAVGRAIANLFGKLGDLLTAPRRQSAAAGRDFKPGVLDVPPHYEELISRYYGRGL